MKPAHRNKKFRASHDERTSRACPACGTKVRRDEAKFCSTCGRSLFEDETYFPTDNLRASYHMQRRKVVFDVGRVNRQHARIAARPSRFSSPDWRVVLMFTFAVLPFLFVPVVFFYLLAIIVVSLLFIRRKKNGRNANRTQRAAMSVLALGMMLMVMQILLILVLRVFR